MQTFLPYSDFQKSAQCLDYRRLGKQRVEAKQIYLALTDPNYGWKNHPAVKMWRGYEQALARYGLAICKEWRARDYKDSLMLWFLQRAYSHTLCEVVLPFWIDNEDFHRSHQSNLIRKLPSHYKPLFPGVSEDLPYIWPV